MPTAVLDYDPQGSSLNWLRLRDPLAPKIHGANAAPQKVGPAQLRPRTSAEGTRQLIIDAPAGASGLLLQDMLSRANCIVIPVQPSAIDIHATANFVRDLLLRGNIRARNIRLAVVANRVRKATPVYQPLERFLTSLGLTIVTRLSDSEIFVKAAETGVGIFEMDASLLHRRARAVPAADRMGRRGAQGAHREHGHRAAARRDVGRASRTRRATWCARCRPGPCFPPRRRRSRRRAAAPAKPQLPAWLSRISQRFVE